MRPAMRFIGTAARTPDLVLDDVRQALSEGFAVVVVSDGLDICATVGDDGENLPRVEAESRRVFGIEAIQ